MKIDTILLDMDGVIVDFHSAAMKAHGREAGPRLTWPMGKDLLTVLENPYTDDSHKAAFWNPIDNNPGTEITLSLLTL